MVVPVALLLLGSIALTAAPPAKKKKAAAAKTAVKAEDRDNADDEADDDSSQKDQQAKKTEADTGAEPQKNINDEMEAYRAIQNRAITTVQDLADLLLMYRGEYGKYTSQQKRLDRVLELGLIQKEHSAHEELDLGTLAYSLMKVYEPEKGWLYMLTGWERYALRDVQEAGIMPQKATPAQKLSGEQLFAIMTDAEEYVTKRSEWQKEKKQ